MGTDLKRRFGSRVKALRRAKGISQEQLADRLGVTVESVGNIERGIHGPKFDLLARIAEELGVEVRELFEFGDEAAET